MNSKIKGAIEILVVIGLFIFVSYLIQNNLELIQSYVKSNILGMAFYILISIIAVIIAPISSTPLIPVASNLWGWFIAGVLSIIGWTIGAIVAFILARKYGIPIIRKFISFQKIHKFESKVPQDNLFWSVVFLRIILPVDLLSYALGLFSKMNLRDYTLATIIGITPFAFIFAYLGTIPILYQIIAFIILIIIFSIGYIIREMKKNKVSKTKKY